MTHYLKATNGNLKSMVMLAENIYTDTPLQLGGIYVKDDKRYKWSVKTSKVWYVSAATATSFKTIKQWYRGLQGSKKIDNRHTGNTASMLSIIRMLTDFVNNHFNAQNFCVLEVVGSDEKRAKAYAYYFKRVCDKLGYELYSDKNFIIVKK